MNIGYDASTMSGLLTGYTPPTGFPFAHVSGNVYGGGSQGQTVGVAAVGETPAINVETKVFVKHDNTPMQYAGGVEGNTNVNVAAGLVEGDIFGGGELASVGTISNATKHESAYPFNISWPYKFEYADNTGKTSININGGRIGITGKDYMGPWDAPGGHPIGYNSDGSSYPLNEQQIDDAEEDNGDIYGAGKGKAGDRYTMAYLNNVKETDIKINYTKVKGVLPSNATTFLSA